MTERALIGREWDAVELLGEYRIPESLHAGLERYLKHGIRPGGFLCAVISNDLKEAALRGDPVNQPAIPRIVAFLCAEVSDTAWGSPAKLDQWIADRQRDRQRREGASV